jgi:hypothetical protein
MVALVYMALVATPLALWLGSSRSDAGYGFAAGEGHT